MRRFFFDYDELYRQLRHLRKIFTSFLLQRHHFLNTTDAPFSATKLFISRKNQPLVLVELPHRMGPF